MFSSPKTRELGQKFCYIKQFLIPVNYLHILVEEDGGLISDDTNLDIKTQRKGDEGKGAFQIKQHSWLVTRNGFISH